MRRNERFLELNDDYEFKSKGRQLGGGHDDRLVRFYATLLDSSKTSLAIAEF